MCLRREDGWSRSIPARITCRRFAQTRGMSLYEDTEVGDYLSAHCRVTGEKHVCTACRRYCQHWPAFVWMTPLNQDLSAKEKDALAARPADTVTIDLHVVCGELQP